MSGNPPPGVPADLITPQGNVPAINLGSSQDYPRLVFTSPYFETVAIAEIIQPSVTEAVEAVLPSLVPPYVDNAVLAGIQQYAVLLTGSTMSGPLFLSPLMPTADAQAATKAYVDTMLATAGIPEVPPVPTGQIWGRETGQWVPISQAEGTFLPITGGSMQGNINMSGNTLTNMAAVPAMPNGAAPAQWVLNQIASVSLYQGTWDADTNVPDLTQLSTHVNAYTWIAITTSPSGVVIGPAIPGLQGQTVFNGDTIIFSTAQGAFSSIHAGGISLPEADGRYVQLAGSQMSGALLLNANATQPLQAATFGQLEAAVANTVTPDAPADGQGYLRVGVGTTRWTPGLPLAGGVLTGALTLAGPGASGNNAVTVAQLNSAITGVTAGLMPIAGGTFTGPVILNGNATTNLNPVPLQQVNSMLGTYAPLQNPAFSGVPTAPTATPASTNTTQIATTAFTQSALAGYLPIAGGTVTGALTVNGILTAAGDILQMGAFGQVVGATGPAINIQLSAGNNLTSIGLFANNVQVNGTLGSGTHTVTGGITVSGTSGLQAVTCTTLTASTSVSTAIYNGPGSAGATLATGNAGGGTIGFLLNAATIGLVPEVSMNAGAAHFLAMGPNATNFSAVSGAGGPTTTGLAYVDYAGNSYQIFNDVVSDERIKENITASTVDALSVLSQIPVQQYDVPSNVAGWYAAIGKSGSERDDALANTPAQHVAIGLITQQISPQIPEAVTSSNMPQPEGSPLPVDLQTWNAQSFVPYLVLAIQQLAQRVGALEAA